MNRLLPIVMRGTEYLLENIKNPAEIRYRFDKNRTEIIPTAAFYDPEVGNAIIMSQVLEIARALPPSLHAALQRFVVVRDNDAVTNYRVVENEMMPLKMDAGLLVASALSLTSVAIEELMRLSRASKTFEVSGMIENPIPVSEYIETKWLRKWANVALPLAPQKSIQLYDDWLKTSANPDADKSIVDPMVTPSSLDEQVSAILNMRIPATR